ncbi:efflux RND transporter periplasmic adaptor subunit [Martelella sp. HB161492]|uniref:efflux RND transporter periplasmic adaptor subunit n=1 Tax=Martelella sp. HB161492 TaxID=2720726 RepID=UPI0015901442|nr:efflux RND transporter periplasmic adaptor subunit [Martelella sp. HB161492]
MRDHILLPLIALMMLAGCDRAEPAAEPVRPVLSVIATPSAGRSQTFAGVVAAHTETDLAFRVLGQITDRDVDIGDKVQAGDILARIDPTSYELSVTSAEANVASAHAALDKASSNLARQNKLYSANATSKSTLEEANQAFEGARASVKQAEANLAKAREQLSYTRLVAAFDGVVTDVSAEVGQTVSAGEPVLTLAKLGARDVVLDVPGGALATVKIGQLFDTRLQLNGQFSAIGKVREISPDADPVTRTWRVKLALQDPPEAYRLGSTVTAISMNGRDRQLLLPATAILSDNGGTRVWVVDPDTATVHTVAVKTEDTVGSDTVAILSGIEPGTRVVTAGIHSLDEGQPVKIAGGADHE